MPVITIQELVERAVYRHDFAFRIHSVRVYSRCFPFRHVFPSCRALTFRNLISNPAFLDPTLFKSSTWLIRLATMQPISHSEPSSFIMSDAPSSNMPTVVEEFYTEDQKKLVNNPLYRLLRKFFHTLSQSLF